MYPALGLPPAALEPVLDALGRRTEAFGVNFIVPVMRRESLDLAVARAPYVDFFPADPTRRWSSWCTPAAASAAGRWNRDRRPSRRRRRTAISSSPRAWESAAVESDAHPAWVRAVIAATAEQAVVSDAFNVGLPEPGPHRVLRGSIDAAQALSGDHAGVVRLAGAEIPVPRFGAQPPTRESTGAVEAMPFYAGQSAEAVVAIQPAADSVAELATGAPSSGAQRASSPTGRG